MARKSRKSKKNSLVESVIRVFRATPYSTLNHKQLSHLLGIRDKASRALIIDILDGLVRKNVLREEKRGKYRLTMSYYSEVSPHSTITGIVDMKQTGKAYIIPDEPGEDIFVSAGNTNHALHGDRVKVLLFPKRKGRKIEGQVIEIISRSKKQFVGIIEVSKYMAFLKPDNTAIPLDIIIPKEKLNGAKNGLKVIVRITEWPDQSNNPFGEVIEVLGKPGKNDVEMNSILAEFDFPLSFSVDAEKEAASILTVISEKEIKSRRDFRKVFTCTIDPQDAKDFDDALSIKKLENGNWEVGVHIADVSQFVKKGGIIDMEAMERGTSVYLVDRVIPMLPELLSNQLCSLRPDEDKLCYAVVFEMSNDAEILDTWIGKTIIRSNRRFNYDEVQDIIEGKSGDYKNEIGILHQLAVRLRKERYKKGSIAFKSREIKFVLDENSRPIDIYVKKQKESNELIEDFMLLANKTVAEKIGKPKDREKAKTFVYRIHDQPISEKLAVFAEFVNKLGYSINTTSRKSTVNSFNLLFKQIEGRGEANMIETIAIRTMAKAVYSTENIGHYGLSFKYYTHFTSPIRRYPDLMVHRLLFDYMQGKPSVEHKEYEEKCNHASDMEKKATEAERASVKYKQAEFMMDKIGLEFEGLISGVSKWGLFVELKASHCEGMIPLKFLGDDYYYLDDENYMVIGQRSGKTYRLGDEIRVIIKDVDLSRKQIDLMPAE